MKNKIFEFLKNFFPYRMRRQKKELFVSNMIINFALAMVQIFEPIYLYKAGYSIFQIALFYFVVYFVYFFLIPLGAKFANKYGYESGMFLGSALYIPFYLALFIFAQEQSLLFIPAILYALQKTFYWPAFHADFAHNSTDREEGREISASSISSSLMFIVGPILGGLIISLYGFPTLFITTSILFLVSNIPMIITKEEFTKRSFRYSFIFKDLFYKSNIKNLLSSIAYAEELIVMVFWPIFMMIVIDNYEKIGILSGVSTMIMLLFTLYIGRVCDKRDKEVVLRLSSFFYAFTWIAKIFTRSIMPVFLFDTASKTTKSGIDVSMRSMVYENARNKYRSKNDENDNSIMEGIVSFEAGLIIGKVFACIVMMLFAMSFTGANIFTAGFLFAAIFSLFYMFL